MFRGLNLLVKVARLDGKPIESLKSLVASCSSLRGTDPEPGAFQQLGPNLMKHRETFEHLESIEIHELLDFTLCILSLPSGQCSACPQHAGLSMLSAISWLGNGVALRLHVNGHANHGESIAKLR